MMLTKTLTEFLAKSLFTILIKTPACFEKSNLARYVYTLFFLCSFSLACILLSPWFRRYFENISMFCDNFAPLGACMSHDPSFVALYRVFATVCSFFLILCLLLYNVNTRDNPRDVIQNGCWILKIILIISIFLCVVNIPKSFSRISLYVSLLSTFLFTLTQFFMFDGCCWYYKCIMDTEHKSINILLQFDKYYNIFISHLNSRICLFLYLFRP